MTRNPFEFIYQAMNAIASRKHDIRTEQILAREVEKELLALNAQAVLEQGKEIIHAEAGLAVA